MHDNLDRERGAVGVGLIELRARVDKIERSVERVGDEVKRDVAAGFDKLWGRLDHLGEMREAEKIAYESRLTKLEAHGGRDAHEIIQTLRAEVAQFKTRWSMLAAAAGAIAAWILANLSDVFTHGKAPTP